MPKYQIQIMEICHRTTTIELEAPDYKTAFEKAMTAPYGENDFSVEFVKQIPISVVECVPDIPDEIDVFMANVISTIDMYFRKQAVTCEGIDFNDGMPIWTIRYIIPNATIQFVHLCFSQDWTKVEWINVNGHCRVAEDLKISKLNANIIARLLS